MLFLSIVRNFVLEIYLFHNCKFLMLVLYAVLHRSVVLKSLIVPVSEENTTPTSNSLRPSAS